MKVSLNWLRELVELPPSVPTLVDLLTMAGVEVEGIETTGCSIANIIVCEIQESVQHPNADRLNVCKVDDGTSTPRQIVCGAKNYRVGDKVPVALPGAQLAPDFTIKVGKLRGVESHGMLCSADELGLPATLGARGAEDGLLILPPNSKPGAPFSEVFHSDTILDLEITPNRPDLLSHYGLAREIAALTDRSAKNPLAVLRETTAEPFTRIETPLCPCYSLHRIEGITVGASPDWLREKLEAVGLRSINSVVDLTNFAMLNIGQPLHAFDADKIRGAIRVRMSRAGEELVALDGKTYRLAENDIVIADEDGPVAIAGVMGGALSGVTADTKNILLESADFESTSIRRTARRLSLHSDSSYRFERGVDDVAVVPAGFLAGARIAEITGGTIVSSCVGYSHDDTKPSEPGRTVYFASPSFCAHVSFDYERCRKLLGTEIPDARMDSILTGFGLKKNGGEWLIPSWRGGDLWREVDLIEEIARVVGMDAIPARTQARFAGASPTDRNYDRAMALRRALASQGLHEARSLTLTPAQPLGLGARQLKLDDALRVKNPMIEEQVTLRPSLLHGLLTAVRENVRAGAKTVRVFEVGRIFHRQRPEEFMHAALVLSGPLGERSWRTDATRDADVFDLKGILTAALGTGTTFAHEENSALALSLSVKMNGKCVGLAGQFWPADARALDATSPIIFAELDLHDLAKAEESSAKKYHEIPRFPAMSRDIAMLAPLELSHDAIAVVLEQSKEPLLAGVELFDVFTDATGAKVPADKKSLAYSFTYRSAERTLTTDEVNAAHAKLKKRLKSELGVALRE